MHMLDRRARGTSKVDGEGLRSCKFVLSSATKTPSASAATVSHSPRHQGNAGNIASTSADTLIAHMRSSFPVPSKRSALMLVSEL